MIRHLFKLIWNNKGAYSLLILELLASFMVLFGVMSLVLYKIANYFEPIGFKYENVWQLSLSNNQDTAQVDQKVENIYNLVKTYPQVESISTISGSAPFSGDKATSGVSYNGVRTQITDYETDENFAQTIDLPLTAGRWYKTSDKASKYPPVVINQAAATTLFGNENPVGKILMRSDKGKLVVGTIGNYKSKGEFMENSPAIIMLNEKFKNKIFLIKVKPDTGVDFEEKLLRNISNSVKGWNTELTYLTDTHKNQNRTTFVPVIIFMIICIFLLVNVALGLFGVLNLNINKRRGEIGLRRAAGATEKNIVSQFLGEIWMLATFSMVIGLLFAVQFPLMNVFDVAASVYIAAILLAVFLIYLIVTLCAWYPSHKASQVQPAAALHED